MTTVKRTQDELLAELTTRFGDNPHDWAFQCPHCGDIATGRDIRNALDQTGRTEGDVSLYLGRECIGRLLGALAASSNEEYTGRGCDWAAYGLFQGPEFVITPDGRELPAFPIASAR